MTNLTQNSAPVQDPSDFFAECREAHQKKVKKVKLKKAEREARNLEKEREKLLRMLEERLDLPRTALTFVEDKASARFDDLTFYLYEARSPGFYSVELIACRPDPDSKDHILRSYDISSREDLGAFLNGHIEDRNLTQEAWERKEAEKEADYEPTPKHEKEADAPARPVLTSNQHGDVFTNKSDRGLTKREAFAARALQGIIASDGLWTMDAEPAHEHRAEDAVRAADALLKALYPQSTDGAGGDSDE